MGFAGSATASMLDARSRSSPDALTIDLSLALRFIARCSGTSKLNVVRLSASTSPRCSTCSASCAGR
ncbi:hypothetical protein ABIC50_001954 [Burkholderia sp. 567]